jgi:hypothetical protein
VVRFAKRRRGSNLGEQIKQIGDWLSVQLLDGVNQFIAKMR